jgi:hypothetical protein
VQLEAHAPSVPPSETLRPPRITEDSTLTPLTALTALDDAIENLGVRQVPLPHLPADGGLPRWRQGAA